ISMILYPAKTQYVVSFPILILASILSTIRTDAEASSFSLTCAFKGGGLPFVISGSATTGEATIVYENITRKALVKADLTTSRQTTLAISVRGTNRTGVDWRDLYVINTALGTFTHVAEKVADFQIMAVQSGTCTSTR